MNKAKVIEALNMIIEALGEEVSPVATETAETVKAPKTEKEVKTTKKQKVVEEVTEEPSEDTEYTPDGASDVTVDEIKSMTYNELKKYAQSLGVKAVGTRDQIVDKVIKAMGNSTTEEEVEETPVEEKVVPISKGKKAGLKKKEETEEPEEPEMDELEKMVREEAKDMDVTDIAETLQSVGIKASGKKEKLMVLLIKAVRDGKLAFDSDEDEEPEDVAEDVAEDGEDVDFTEYHSEYDPNGLNDPSTMSKKRAKAVTAMVEREVEAISSGETTEKDVKDFLETLLTEDEKEELNIGDMGENELIFAYLELMKSMIDDDGEEHEPSDPYSIGEENVCCGHVLVYDEESENYICQSCGQNYEAE